MRLFTPILLSLFLLLLPVSSHAQKISDLFKKELPIYESEFLPQDIFESETQYYDVIPFKDDKELHYQVRLPKDWAESKNESINTYGTSDKVLGEIVRYYSPVDKGERSYFSINVQDLKYEISALHWFMNYVVENSITLQGIKEYNKSRVEALYVQVIDDTSYVIRTVAQMTGDRVVLAQIYTPIRIWQKFRATQNQIINSFNLPVPKNVEIENMKEIRFLDIAMMEYPESWYLKEPNTRNVDNMSVKLVNLNAINVLNGRIEVHLLSTYSDETLQAYYDKIKTEVEDTGLKIKGLMAKPDSEFKFHPEMDYGVVDVYKAINKIPYIINYELWVAVMAGDGYFYFVTLLTPSRDEEFFVWARNVEALKIVTENIGPSEIIYK